MKKTSLFFIAVFLFLSSNDLFAQTTVSFQDGVSGYSGTQDSFVRETQPGANFGTNTVLRADGADGAPPGEVASLVKWDISSIPASANIISATLSLALFNTSAGAYNLHIQKSNWTEGTVDWNDLAAGSDIIGVINPGTSGVNNINLNTEGLAAVKSWVNNPAQNFGIAIKTAGSNDGIAARSREAAAFHPKLEITYTTGGTTIEDLLALITTLQAQNAAQQTQINTLNTILSGVGRVGNTIQFEGVNVQILNGLGSTNGGNQVNGLGNLIVGYNEPISYLNSPPSNKTGSHNVVVGYGHNYSSYGGLVVGSNNAISGIYSSVSGGERNIVSGSHASISGGIRNVATSTANSISGGLQNMTSGNITSISGGFDNDATGNLTSILGGTANETSFSYTTISGGRENEAYNEASSVCGGRGNRSGGQYSVISGGRDNIAAHSFTSISGGFSNLVNNLYAHISGGNNNQASGQYSTVSGGLNRNVAGLNDWRAGGLFQAD